VIAVLPLSEWKALIDKKMEASQELKTLVKLIDIPALMVSNLHVYLNNVNCCLCYVHNTVHIIVMNALLLPTECCGHCAILARIL